MSTRCKSIIIAIALMQCAACAGAKSPTPSGPVDFAFEMEGRLQRLQAYRRRPVMLVLMRTSDIVSQIYMQEVAAVYSKRAGQLRMLVLTIETTEKPFVDMYATSENLPFPIGVADRRVAMGASSLGPVDAVPATYLIDDTGRITSMHLGVIPAETLISEIDDLLDF